MIDQALVTLDEFRGVFANNEEDVVPPNHFKDALNIAYGPGIFFSRPGIVAHLTIADVRRIRVYQIPGEDDRLLVLNGSGELFDTSVSSIVPILTIVTPNKMTDFTAVSIFGRAYISPHDGQNGLENEFLYVYDGTGVARRAGGLPPQGFEITLALVTPTPTGADIVAPVAPANGPQTLTTSPYIPNIPNTIRFTQTGGAVTNITITVIGIDSGGDAITKVYIDKIKSAGPPTYVTPEIWKQITSITISNLVGAGGTFKVETTGVPGGKIDVGTHVVGIVYETISGFLTKPGPENNLKAIFVGRRNRAIRVSGIPAAPGDEVAKIHIVMSKAIARRRYTGNPDPSLYEMFFVPKGSGGEIAVGETETVINAFDADLLNSADYLLDNLSEIPAGCTLLATSKGRLLIGGEFENNAILRASVGGEPEVFSATDGFVICDPVTGGVKNLAEYRDSIYPLKSHATLITQDNGDLPSTWTINQIDRAIGTEPHAVATVLGREADVEDAIIVADRSGLHAFNGAYPGQPLSWKIKEIWDTLSSLDFYKTELAIDPVNKIIIVVFQATQGIQPVEVQRILNPGFETGDLTSWTATAGVAVITDGGLGVYVAELTDTGTPQQLDQSFTILDSETAEISVMGAVPIGSGVTTSTQRVTNPGFETGDITGWTDTGDFTVVVIPNPGSGSGDFVAQLTESGENHSSLEQSITIVDSEVATVSASGAGPLNTSSVNFFAHIPVNDLWLQPDGSWGGGGPWATFSGSDIFTTLSVVTTVPTGDTTVELIIETDGDVDNNGDLLADEYTWTTGDDSAVIHFRAYAPTLDLYLNSVGSWAAGPVDWATAVSEEFTTFTLNTTVPTGETTIQVFAITEIISGPGGEFYVDEYTWTTTEETPTAVDTCLMADYSEGLDWQNIKWGALWEFYNQTGDAFTPETVVTHFDSSIGKVVFRLGQRDSTKIYSYEHGNSTALQIFDDDGQTISYMWESYKYSASEDGAITHLAGMRIKITGFGLCDLSLIGANGRPIEVQSNLTIPGSSNGNILEKFNFVDDDISIKFTLDDFRTYFQVSKIWVFGTEIWGEKPSGLEFDLHLDLMAYWDLEEASGNRLDASGNGNTLTPINAPGNIAGIVGNAVQLVRASSQNLEIVSNSTLQIGSGEAFHIGCWVYLDTAPGVSEIYSFMSNGAGTQDYGLEFSSNTNPGVNSYVRFFYLDAGSVTRQTLTVFTLTPLTWYFVTGWYDPTILTTNLQINDYAPSSTIQPAIPRTSVGGTFWIGQRAATHYMNGRIDEPFVRKKVPTAHEIEYLWNKGNGRNYGDLNE